MTAIWYPGPRYLLRKHCVLRLLRGLLPGRVLEVGCAQGNMLRTLAERGFSGLGVDLSEVAVRMASETLAGLEDRVQIVLAGAEDGTGPYDCVVCFEVLEHIRDDQAALRRWRALLRSGGRLLLSVPAGPRRWGPSDEVVGHYRRYSRAGLHELLDRTGFRVEHLWCYGFPVANLSQYFGNRADRQRSAQTAAIPREERSARSGVDAAALEPYRWLWSNPAFRVFCWLQTLFLHTDWGNGYIVRAQAV
ncbi:MAG: class I SAM-dependent methyltransferase [Phycisphaerae bacterium]|jgi:SAM-dependent methyltransferase